MPGKVELVGVYQLPITEELSASQAELLYGGTPSMAQRKRVRDQLDSTVLVEVLASGADYRFNVSDFVQEDPDLAHESGQAAWAEAFLSVDGQQLLVERWEPLPDDRPNFRVAFFIHHWNSVGALLSSYGRLPASQPQTMPD